MLEKNRKIWQYLWVPVCLALTSAKAMEANTTEFFKGKCKGPKFCSRSARAVFKACRNESKDDYWIAVGNRINLSSPEGRAECIEEAKIALREARQLCIDQRQARLEVCEELSEAPYDPQISPADFVYMETISSETANPYLPLVLGTQWIYKGETKILKLIS